MAETARQIITLALKECGPLGVGQTALSEDMDDGLTLLTRMIAQWQRRRWLIPSLMDISAVGNSLISNKIGNGQYYNTQRPDKIQAGYFTMAGSGGGLPVSFPLYPIFSYEDYSRLSLKTLNSFPYRFFYDAAFPYGNVFIYPIPTSQYTIHLIVKSQLGFGTSIDAGSITTGGAGYISNNYVAVPLTGGNGLSATADITVTGGIVTVVTLANGGQAYHVGDILSASNANLGGAGAGFTWTVNALESNLDSIIDMPEEYNEAIHYNLAIRLSSMYQLQPNADTKLLAKSSLNTIRRANMQVPGLVMPPGLVRGNNNSQSNIYNGFF